MHFSSAMIVALSLAFSAGAVHTASAEPGTAQTIIRSGEQASVKGSETIFTGNVRIDPLYPANNDMRSSGGSVTFEPGARSNWHIHPVGAHRHFGRGPDAGVGQADAGNQGRRRGPLPRGRQALDGAAPNSSMTHSSICEEKEPGKVVEWLERVTDAQYNGE